eukprot:5614880-Pyramimonas_sp.AAC.1
MLAALAGLYVVRTQTGQLGTPTSVCDSAPLAADMAKVRKAADHVQLRLTHISQERDAEKGEGRGSPHPSVWNQSAKHTTDDSRT